MDPNRIFSCIIFDFDGTIANIETDWRGWQEGILKIFQKYEPSFQIDNLEDIYKYQNEFFERYKDTLIQLDVLEFTDDWELENCKKVVPNKMVVEYIKKLHKSKMIMIVWSNNGRNFVQRELQKIGILDCFSYVTSKHLSYLLKPSAQTFEEQIYNPKVPRSEFLMIGNDDESDGGAAKAAGIGYVNIKELFE